MCLVHSKSCCKHQIPTYTQTYLPSASLLPHVSLLPMSLRPASTRSEWYEGNKHYVSSGMNGKWRKASYSGWRVLASHSLSLSHQHSPTYEHALLLQSCTGHTKSLVVMPCPELWRVQRSLHFSSLFSSFSLCCVSVWCVKMV